MNRVDEWIEENCVDAKDLYFNGIDYKIYTMKDGWKAVLRSFDGDLFPVIQAVDEEKAINYISMIEPIPVPANIIT